MYKVASGYFVYFLLAVLNMKRKSFSIISKTSGNNVGDCLGTREGLTSEMEMYKHLYDTMHCSLLNNFTINKLLPTFKWGNRDRNEFFSLCTIDK